MSEKIVQLNEEIIKGQQAAQKHIAQLTPPEAAQRAYGGGQRPLVRSRTAAVRSE